MLADAISAERFRLLKDRGTLFWGVLFAPIAGLVLNIGGELFARSLMKGAPPIPVDIVGRMVKALAGGASPVVGLFVLILSTAVLAGDYRWETWRLLTPRNGRVNLLLAKLATVAAAVAISLVLYTLAAAVGGLFSAATSGGPLVGYPGGSPLVDLAGTFAISWLQLMVLVALSALVGVVTRSTMGALIVGLAFAAVQSIVASQMHEPSLKALAIPAFSGDLLKTVLLMPRSVTDEPAPWALALGFLLAWLAGLSAAALALFQRQDLTRE
ncbi:ABC transporter permease subunit [Caulobacter sp. 602-2]|uniref:ABC transporter permease subunit n=1 Tax=Caulobacter sp. 602-2 TaxID=2710887 RepID=A0A6G4R465_9CAUL|nr:ABC transporter permease subunit [Caulobacter sp. 602-2]NGM52499.1 ABC transporter permease subunit [Caulobacter sp. 602-2]